MALLALVDETTEDLIDLLADMRIAGLVPPGETGLLQER